MQRNEQYGNDYGNDAAGWSKFLAGAFLGAGLALLFAPRTGPEMRSMLRDYASRAKDDMVQRGRDAWGTAVERGKEYLERGQDSLREAGQVAREYVESGQEKIKEAGREGVATFNEEGREVTHSA